MFILRYKNSTSVSSELLMEYSDVGGVKTKVTGKLE